MTRANYSPYDDLGYEAKPSRVSVHFSPFSEFFSPPPEQAQVPGWGGRFDQLVDSTVREIRQRSGDLEVHRTISDGGLTELLNTLSRTVHRLFGTGRFSTTVDRLWLRSKSQRSRAAIRLHRHVPGRLHLYSELIFVQNGSDVVVEKHHWASRSANVLEWLWGLSIAFIFFVSGWAFFTGVWSLSVAALFVVAMVVSWVTLHLTRKRPEAAREALLLLTTANAALIQAMR